MACPSIFLILINPKYFRIIPYSYLCTVQLAVSLNLKSTGNSILADEVLFSKVFFSARNLSDGAIRLYGDSCDKGKQKKREPKKRVGMLIKH